MKINISKPQCYTAQGLRDNQEDSLFPLLGEITEETRVFMVCDGMGGHENGEVASACVAETVGKMTSGQPLCSATEMQRLFEKALQQAYRNLDELDYSDSLKKMGTTLTFLSICTDGVLVAHIGDSRVYQFRPDEGVVFQTHDHSLVNDLIAAGEIKEEDAKTHPQRNVITRAIQPHQEYPAKATYNILRDIRKGDLFFLCSDGVLEQLGNSDLCEYLLNDKAMEDRLTAVKDACAARNTRDNNTAYLIEVTEAEGQLKGEDEAMHRVDESDTLVMPSADELKRKKRLRCLATICTIVIIAIIAYALIHTSSDGCQMASKPKTEQKNECKQMNTKPETEPEQGTIQRH